jgi:lipid A 4'-phosphatase
LPSRKATAPFGFATNALSRGTKGASVVMFRHTIPATVIASGACALLFALWPELDLAGAGLFYAGDGHFVGRTAIGDLARKIGYSLPIVVLALLILAWLLRRFGVRCKAPTGQSIAMLSLTMLIGPGLLANLILKDHSHRPRPVQIQEFGGSMEFRPWYRFDGSCRTNCSFVSGEAAEAFWMLAPASLLAPPLLPYGIAAAASFATAVSVLRMAYGGHFLSDVVLAGLLMIFIIGIGQRFSLAKPAP